MPSSERSPKPQVLVLPGMGADHRLSEMLIEAVNVSSDLKGTMTAAETFEFVAPDYIPWRRRESTSEYAGRFYQHLVSSGVLSPQRLRYVIGISLGGAVGLELPRTASLRGVLLIGSLVDSRELIWYARAVARWIAPYLPDWLYRSLTPILPLAQAGISRIPQWVLPVLQSMYSEMPHDFFARSSWALAHWSTDWTLLTHREGPIRLHRIHGEDDHVISRSLLRTDARIVKGAKHLVSVSHASEVASWITDILTSSD